MKCASPIQETHIIRQAAQFLRLFIAVAVASASAPAAAADGVWVRFKLTEPRETKYFVRLGGYIHKSPWYLPGAVVPDGADKEPEKRVGSREFTAWFDLGKYAGNLLHGRMSRAGGIAELPNVTAEFVTDHESNRRTVLIELATDPDENHVEKRFRESFHGSLTSFLVSPTLAADAGHLESASQMTARRLRWAREASGGRTVSPGRLLVQTSFWAPQRAELNLQEAEVLELLGFNVVGNQMPEVRQKFKFRFPGHTHAVDFSPAVTREEADKQIERVAAQNAGQKFDGVPFGYSDEITCGKIGESAQARAHFAAWLEKQKVPPGELGVQNLDDVVPIETPDELRSRLEQDPRAVKRIFYYSSRFRQHATTERLTWLTESLHKHLGPGPLSSTLVADHPYFSGTGLGMGMGPNPAWGRPALAADWFDLARSRAVDLAGIEDWMGLQYMYGPNYTWEGFQLMGFQASIFRSGSRGAMPIMAWITPSDETNLRLKSASALCQGAKHFFYWTYGPTATSTENYWSDLRGAYDGIVNITRQLAGAEHILAPGTPRKTRVALLYSISSDLWQPFGYVHMLERRGTYLSLVHDQYLVDMLTEEDIAGGRLADYDVLYATDPCIKEAAATQIERWVEGGGHLYGTTAAGSRNEFNEESAGLAKVFGIESTVRCEVQPGRYHIRGALNQMDYLDEIQSTPLAPREATETQPQPAQFGAMGVKVQFNPANGTVAGKFKDGSPAVVRNAFGKGQSLYVGACPAIAYLKEAKFVPGELKEAWPEEERAFINATVRGRGVAHLVELSHPVVEAGVYDAPEGTALVLANFTYQPIDNLKVRLLLAQPVKTVRSLEQGRLRFSSAKAGDDDPPGYSHTITFSVSLGLNDTVLLEP